eukprot:Rhum_TRINITY_DN13680_c0_g1::Rhum_TRINITY_DN13680_c0_g1_i1::g.62710::m.62710
MTATGASIGREPSPLWAVHPSMCSAASSVPLVPPSQPCVLGLCDEPDMPYCKATGAPHVSSAGNAPAAAAAAAAAAEPRRTSASSAAHIPSHAHPIIHPLDAAPHARAPAAAAAAPASGAGSAQQADKTRQLREELQKRKAEHAVLEAQAAEQSCWAKELLSRFRATADEPPPQAPQAPAAAAAAVPQRPPLATVDSNVPVLRTGEASQQTSKKESVPGVEGDDDFTHRFRKLSERRRRPRTPQDEGDTSVVPPSSPTGLFWTSLKETMSGPSAHAASAGHLCKVECDGEEIMLNQVFYESFVSVWKALRKGSMPPITLTIFKQADTAPEDTGGDPPPPPPSVSNEERPEHSGKSFPAAAAGGGSAVSGAVSFAPRPAEEASAAASISQVREVLPMRTSPWIAQPASCLTDRASLFGQQHLPHVPDSSPGYVPEASAAGRARPRGDAAGGSGLLERVNALEALQKTKEETLADTIDARISAIEEAVLREKKSARESQTGPALSNRQLRQQQQQQQHRQQQQQQTPLEAQESPSVAELLLQKVAALESVVQQTQQEQPDEAIRSKLQELESALQATRQQQLEYERQQHAKDDVSARVRELEAAVSRAKAEHHSEVQQLERRLLEETNARHMLTQELESSKKKTRLQLAKLKAEVHKEQLGPSQEQLALHRENEQLKMTAKQADMKSQMIAQQAEYNERQLRMARTEEAREKRLLSQENNALRAARPPPPAAAAHVVPPPAAPLSILEPLEQHTPLQDPNPFRGSHSAVTPTRKEHLLAASRRNYGAVSSPSRTPSGAPPAPHSPSHTKPPVTVSPARPRPRPIIDEVPHIIYPQSPPAGLPPEMPPLRSLSDERALYADAVLPSQAATFAAAADPSRIAPLSPHHNTPAPAHTPPPHALQPQPGLPPAVVGGQQTRPTYVSPPRVQAAYDRDVPRLTNPLPPDAHELLLKLRSLEAQMANIRNSGTPPRSVPASQPSAVSDAVSDYRYHTGELSPGRAAQQPGGTGPTGSVQYNFWDAAATPSQGQPAFA